MLCSCHCELALYVQYLETFVKSSGVNIYSGSFYAF